MNLTKRIIGALTLAFGSLLVLAFILNNVSPSPVTVARSVCGELGWPEEQLELRAFRTSARITGSKGSVDFTVDNEGETKLIRVTLQKPLYSFRWNVLTCEEVKDE